MLFLSAALMSRSFPPIAKVPLLVYAARVFLTFEKRLSITFWASVRGRTAPTTGADLLDFMMGIVLFYLAKITTAREIRTSREGEDRRRRNTEY